MKKLICLFSVVILLIVAGCSSERENNTAVGTAVRAVPGGWTIYPPVPAETRLAKYWAEGKKYSLDQMKELYVMDMADAAGKEYEEGLSSMWISNLSMTAQLTGTDAEKLDMVNWFTVQGLPAAASYSSVYGLLQNCREFASREKLDDLANTIYKRNKSLIAAIANSKPEISRMYDKNLDDAIKTYKMFMDAPLASK